MTSHRSAILEAGFRPFFLGACLYSIISIALWSGAFFGEISLRLSGFSMLQWHAHEMIFGYSMAVVAGFLLTAIPQWTGIKTARNGHLMLLFSVWAGARILFCIGGYFVMWAAVLDTIFSLMLVVAISKPVFKRRQWRQMAVISKVVLLALFNLMFYLAALQLIVLPIEIAIYGGFYLLIGLILTMARRVVPSFIEGGVGYAVTLKNNVYLDRSSLILFLAFFVVEGILSSTRLSSPWLSSSLALLLCLVNATRLFGWYTSGIWKKSLLWGLYLSLWFITLGFLLHAAHYFTGVSKYLGVHALAVGGVGVITMSMMARVSWGHTGRSIHNPPAIVSVALALLVMSAVSRVLLPILIPGSYSIWIGLAQLTWIMSFSLFVSVYFYVLIRPRADAGGLPFVVEEQ